MDLTKIQKEILESKHCPTCGDNARFKEIEEENEIILVCENCDTTIDSDGGSIKG